MAYQLNTAREGLFALIAFERSFHCMMLHRVIPQLCCCTQFMVTKITFELLLHMIF